MCKDTHSKVGTGRSQMPNEAEPKTNWSLLLRLRRIEENCLGGQGDSRDRGGHGTAWLGPTVVINAITDVHTHGEQQGVAPGAS